MTLLNKRPKIGITIKLFLLFICLGLIPIIFMSFYSFWQINRQVALEAENNLTDVGLRLKDDVARFITARYRSVESLAQDPVFSGGRADRTDMEREIARIRAVSPEIRGLFVLVGHEVYAAGGPVRLVQDGVDLVEFSGGVPRIGSPRLFSGAPGPALLIGVPVGGAEGGPATTLLAAVDVRELSDMTTLVRIGETGRAVVIDDRGLIVAGPDGTAPFSPFSDEDVTGRIVTVGEGIIHYVDRDDRGFIAFVTTIPGVNDAGPRGLKVVVSYGEDEAYLIAGQIRRTLGLAIIIILVVTSLVSFALSGAITGPIKEIIRGTERIGAGDFSHEIPESSRDELGDLALSFNRMAKELGASRAFMENYNRELEQKVRERSRKLEESERKYRMVVEGSGDAWTILDDTLVIHFANGKMGELLGTDPASLAGRSLADFIGRSEEGRIRKAVSDVLGLSGSSLTVQWELSAREGARVVLEATLSAIPGQGSERQVIAHLVDKTQLAALASEKERLQLELMERSKHSQIGIMTEGLFHNLNNPLQALMGLLKVLRQDLELELTDGGGDKVRALEGRRRDLLHDADEAYSVSLRLSDQVKNLLLKIRNESMRKVEDLDINLILGAEVSFLEADLFFKHKIEKNLILADGLPRLPGVYSDLSQSFVNIILNATDAMRESTAKRLTIITSLRKKKIAVTFHDTGAGIDPLHIPHIFDPFFSTKGGQHQGAGLGLFTVDFLLKPYRATYEVTSAPGKTSFTILFPTGGLKRSKTGTKNKERRP
jgi:PAS domain S-box-containing protein